MNHTNGFGTFPGADRLPDTQPWRIGPYVFDETVVLWYNFES